MADAIISFATAAGEWIAMEVFIAATEIGIPLEVAATIANVVGTAAEIGIQVGVSMGVNALFQPDVPRPEAGETSLKQTMPQRRYALSRCRLGGAYVCWESKHKTYDIVAILDQQVSRLGDYWLHDDKVTLDGYNVEQLTGGAYGGNRVKIWTRLGLPTETSYTADVDFSPLGTGVWTEDHRGDGITSACIVTDAASQEKFHRVFPNGSPVLSVEAFPLLYDWRDEDQDIEDIDTWGEADGNPVVALANYLTGYRDATADPEKQARWDRIIAPQLSAWTQAADDCDATVPLKAGGTEPRYRIANLWHNASTHPAEVLAKILEAMDGWVAEDGDGSWTIQAGYYRTPTINIDGNRPNAVRSISFNRGRQSERTANHWPFKYLSVAQDYYSVPGDPWRNDDMIDDAGEEISDPVEFGIVPSHGQARRLLKRRDLRVNCLGWGTITFDYCGLALPGERYFSWDFVDGEWDSLDGAVFEIIGKPRMDFQSMAVEVDVIQVDPTKLNAWDAATEEGEAPDLVGDTDEDEAGDEEIAITDAVWDESALARFLVTVNDYGAVHKVALRYRVDGDTLWTEASPVTPAPNGLGGYYFVSPNLDWDTDYELSVAAVDSDDFYSPWSPTPFDASMPPEPGGP